MTYPVGVQLATLTFSNPITFLGTEAARTEVTVQSTAGVVWTATGMPIDDFPEVVAPAAALPGSLTLPFVDQDGFTDQAGNAFTMWAYVITRRTIFGSSQKIVKKNWAPVIGQNLTDFDNLPGGSIGLPVSAPPVPVTSVASLTGAVDAESLAGELVEFIPSGVTPETVAANLPARLEASVIAADLAEKLDADTAAITYAAKSVETDKLDVTAATTALGAKMDTAARGAASGVAGLDSGSKLLETNIPTRLSDGQLSATYAAKSVETSKLDASQKGAVSGVAPLDAGQLVPQANLPAHLTVAAQNATILDKIKVEDAQPATSLAAAFPNVYRKITTHNDVTGTPLIVASIGTSVGVGAATPDPATQAPGAVFTTKLATAINRLGNMTFTHQNSAVNGSVENELLTQYTAAKAAVGVPHALLIVQGMNGGMPFHYHTGQTFPGVYDGLKAVVEAAQSDGVDVVIATTPHPHTVDTPWSGPGSWSYPQASPAALVPNAGATASVVSVKSPSGVMVPASYRHLRVNETARRIAGEYGLVVIDAERYHFDAVAKYGENALHDTGDYAHPNLFGHQQTYGKAIDALVRSLTAPAVQANSPRPSTTYRMRKSSNSTRTTTTRTADTQLQFTAGANQVWEVEVDVFYTTPLTADLDLEIQVPSGATGKLAVSGVSSTATVHSGSEAVSRSGNVAGNWMTVGGNNSDAWATVKAIVKTSATAGIVGLAYGQSVASGTSTIYADTYLRATRLA